MTHGYENPSFAASINPNANLYEIYCGEKSLEYADDYYRFSDKKPIGVMALRWGRSPFDFNWPVENKICSVVAIGQCGDIPNDLGLALINSGAKKVYLVIDGKVNLL